jgi:hypothetical protein
MKIRPATRDQPRRPTVDFAAVILEQEFDAFDPFQGAVRRIAISPADQLGIRRRHLGFPDNPTSEIGLPRAASQPAQIGAPGAEMRYVRVHPSAPLPVETTRAERVAWRKVCFPLVVGERSLTLRRRAGTRSGRLEGDVLPSSARPESLVGQVETMLRGDATACGTHRSARLTLSAATRPLHDSGMAHPHGSCSPITRVVVPWDQSPVVGSSADRFAAVTARTSPDLGDASRERATR